ncbi:hypothetical protein [Streptomyces chilikensis]|uniref:Uncharacterized protein n=1 Tax=Streptomyces chilikensis TaxID=1194079 RepID=A0ABV3EJG8_9ACTN
MNVRGWPLRTLLAAAEAAMDQAAEDDAERARNRAELYAPPREARRRATKPSGMGAGQVSALLAQAAAEDGMRAGR